MVTAENWHDPAMIARYVDRFLGSTGHLGPGHYFADVRQTPVYRDGQPFTLPPNTYKTDAISDFAVEFIAQAAGKDRPFFLYIAHLAPIGLCMPNRKTLRNIANSTGSWAGMKRGHDGTKGWLNWD